MAMFGGETTCCGKTLLFLNFLISFSCMIALSTIILYLTLYKHPASGNNTGNAITGVDNTWNDDVEIDKVCGFDKYPVSGDNGIKYGRLKWMGALFRHGDRTPIWFLDSDPYKNYDFPEGHEMLTNIGRRRMYCYGVALRRRYRNYIDTVKTPNVIAFSSWYRRTIETNELVLTGMFPPTQQNTWAPSLQIGKRWQAIGVGSAEFSRSWMLLDEATCPAAEKIQSETHPVLSDKQKAFLVKLSKITNSTVQDVDDVYHIYDTLLIEKQYFGNDFIVPSWFEQIDGDVWQKMEEIVELSFGKFKNTPEFLRLRSGVFLEHLYEISKNITNRTMVQSPMVHTFSSHDTTITPIIQALGLYNKPPTYGSGLVFEIREIDNKFVLRLLYVDVFNHNTFIDLDLSQSSVFKDTCPNMTCDVDVFFKALSDKNYLINIQSIEQECALSNTKQRKKLLPRKFFPKRTLDN